MVLGRVKVKETQFQHNQAASEQQGWPGSHRGTGPEPPQHLLRACVR